MIMWSKEKFSLIPRWAPNVLTGFDKKLLTDKYPALPRIEGSYPALPETDWFDFLKSLDISRSLPRIDRFGSLMSLDIYPELPRIDWFRILKSLGNLGNHREPEPVLALLKFGFRKKLDSYPVLPGRIHGRKFGELLSLTYGVKEKAIVPGGRVRSKLFGRQEANYSGFTCYSGLTSYVPPYIDTVR
ncbi:hypothetical protein JHK85_016211 [Glycine max]|nr:hypothetical protein JHK85_016211 [Glycine max]